MTAEALHAWPPDYAKVIETRGKRLLRLRGDRDLQILMMAFYANNPVQFINDLAVTFDPRLEKLKTVPFILFPKQVEFIELLVECVELRESALIEKCRDVGASWLCVAFSVWLWLFRPGATIGWGSRKEEYVDDKGNPKAIFPKIRQFINSLPRWMWPENFTMRECAPYMKIINPQNGATITGEAGDNIGRGGRSTIFFKDESAHYERPELIEAALSENTEVQIDISSVNGMGNVFYRRRQAGVIWEKGKIIPRGKVRVFIFDWRDHPGKDQAWYDAKRAKFESEGMLHIFAQEIERDYVGAKDKIIIMPEWAEACIDAHIKLAHLGNWLEGRTVAGQDVADGGRDVNALCIIRGSVIIHNSAWGGKAEDCAEVAVPRLIDNSVQDVFYDCIGVGTGFKTGANAKQKDGSMPRHIKVYPWDASAEVLDPEKRIIPDDKQSPKNIDHYENFKAQSWFRLRARCWKTFQAVRYGKVYPIGEMISISSEMEGRHELKMELSQAIYKTSGNGKTMVDKQPNDTRSPNRADSAVMAANPPKKPSGFFEDLE